MHQNVSRYGAPHKKVDAFSQTNNCYTSKLESKQSKCPGYVSQRRNICVGRVDLNQCRAEPLKCGAHQVRIMWGGSTGIHVCGLRQYVSGRKEYTVQRLLVPLYDCPLILTLLMRLN